MKLVLVFGDSIVMGLWDERGGWPERLWDGDTRIVYNLGVDGNTSYDVKARFDSEAEARGANKNSIIILAVGINDSSRMNGELRVGLAGFIHNMEKMIDKSRTYFTPHIFCVGLGPVDETKAVPFILEKSISFYVADQREYDKALETLCQKKTVRYISLRNLGIEKHLSEDGVHPLTSGHAIIARRIIETISGVS